MKIMPSLTRLFLTLCLLLADATLLRAQNRIVPAPDAVELRRVWERTGRDLRVDEYGTAMWGGIDISGDGIADFAVYQATGEYPNTWHFYRGGNPPDTAALWRFDSTGRFQAIGNYLGTDALYGIFGNAERVVIDGYSYYFDRLSLFRLTDTGVTFPPIQSVYQGDQHPPVERSIRSISSADVNSDGIPDISLIISGSRVGLDRTTYDHRGQIWIYLGGPDFQIDSPSVIIYDVVGDSGVPDSFNYSAELGDYDGDGRIDVKYANSYAGIGPLVRFRWGDEDSPQSWTERPVDRTIVVNDSGTGQKVQFVGRSYQLDAHPGRDFVSVVGNEDGSSSALIFLSSTESVRTRSFRREEADSEFVLPERFGYGGVSTFINDSLRRFEMLPFARPGRRIFLSGGTYGPDRDYDAYFNEEREGAALGDVTGDGWDDYGAFYPQAGVRATGIATVYAGGPYIPLDDPTLNIREEPVAGKPGGLFLWPNPVVDELNIAWRGDLPRMPARFEIYDAAGRRVAVGNIDTWRGAALWKCRGVPAGHYTIIGFDITGRKIADAPVIVR